MKVGSSRGSTASAVQVRCLLFASPTVAMVQFRHDADAPDLAVGGNAKAAWTPRLGNVLQEAERRAEQLAASL